MSGQVAALAMLMGCVQRWQSPLSMALAHSEQHLSPAPQRSCEATQGSCTGSVPSEHLLFTHKQPACVRHAAPQGMNGGMGSLLARHFPQQPLFSRKMQSSSF